MTALERAATTVAACLADAPVAPTFSMADVNGWTEEKAYEIARAVLMAVRDSTDAMNVSAEEAELPGGQFGEPGFRESSIDELDAPVIWRAMIDAILNEKDTTND